MGSLSVLVGLLALLLAAIWALWSGEVALVIRDRDFVYGPTSLLSGRTNTRVEWKDVVEIEHYPWYGFVVEKQLPGIHVRYEREGGKHFPPDGFARTAPGPVVDRLVIFGFFDISPSALAKVIRRRWKESARQASLVTNATTG